MRSYLMVRRSFLLALLAAWSSAFLVARGDVVINEVMFHPISENVLDEWIELHNTGPGTVDLNGWKFTRGIEYAFSNATIAPGGFVTVAASRTAFLASHPGATNVYGDWLGTLSNTRETIELEDAAGTRIDSVPYADEGDWALRERGPQDGNFRGWVWYRAADGLGSSLELVNLLLPNQYGQNWAPSTVNGGTPGTVNSMRSTNTPPLILDVRHLPLVPRSTDPVSITARVLNQTPGPLTVTLHYRLDALPQGAFLTRAMFDDGAHGDGAANDGIFNLSLGTFTNSTIVEFYVSATNQLGLGRTWPAAARQVNGTFAQTANALLQIDDQTPAGVNPLYRLIMTAGEQNELFGLFTTNANSDAQFNATFISAGGLGSELRYLVGVRNRGHGSRNGIPHNYRINFRSDDAWEGVVGINLNARNPHAQHFGAVIAQKAGVAGANSRAVRLRVNNGPGPGGAPSLGHYAANEVLDSDWAERHFPLDSGGNVYRAIRDLSPFEFNYRGPSPNPYRNTYFKNNNVSEDNWSDLIAMLRIMGTNDLFSATTARSVVNVEQWITHLAVMNIFGNNETGLNTGYNDDYFMYAGVNDPRFLLLYYDLDSILGQGSLGTSADIFSSTADRGAGVALNRFLQVPEFRALYYRTLHRLMETTFSAAQYDSLIQQTLGSYVATGTINSMKTWMNDRRTYILSVVAPFVTPDDSAPVAVISGEPRSPTPRTVASLTVSGDRVTHYKYKLNNGLYSSEIAVTNAIQLGGLPQGSTNVVYVVGRTATGVWQSNADATASRAWVVDTNWSTVRLNEVLARNDGVYSHNSTTPDAIELFNEGASTVNLGGLRLSDDLQNPNKFTFPANTFLGAGQYLIVHADSANNSGFHTGFGLNQDGDELYLLSSGGNVLDSIVFGNQIPNLSVGRLATGDWVLTQPSFGAANVAQEMGLPSSLRINEWLAAGTTALTPDFVELLNMAAFPVALDHLYLTDNPLGWPRRFQFAPLNFIAAGGHLPLVADGDDASGHLPFSLAADVGEIALLSRTLALLDCVSYGPQSLGVAQGRCPNGAATLASLSLPTPGSSNFCAVVVPPTTVSVMPYEQEWRYEQSAMNLGTAWRATDYADGSWPVGQGLLGKLRSGGVQPIVPIRTQLTTDAAKPTFYFRTRFTLPPNISPSALRFTHLTDDGLVLYLNGQEIYRYNMPSGTITFSSLALVNILDAEEVGPIAVPTNALVVGQNVLAAEVHQQSTGSGDIQFGLKVEALVITNDASLAGIVLNEIFAENSSVTDIGGGTPDWIELYNPSSNAVDLVNMSLTDTTADLRRWIFPAGSVIEGYGYLTVRSGSDRPPSATNTGFGLKASGGAVYLVKSGGAIADVLSFGLQTADFSVGRVPDGSSNWNLTLPTIGDANIAAPLGDPLALRINEWLAAPASGDDWFEIYNPNPHPVAIGGFFLTDDLGDPTQNPLPALSFIGSVTNAWKRFEADDNAIAGADHTNFKLSADGEDLALYTAGGVLVDGFSYDGQALGISTGRLPDGDATRENFPSPSPGEANYLPISGVVINEVLTHTDPPLEDAIELRNTTATPINVGGWWLSDSRRQGQKYRIPNDTSINPGSYLVVYEYQFNNTDLAVTPFSLSSAKGDEVYLSAVDGAGRLTGRRSDVDFGAAANGVSFGRYTTSVGVDFTALSARTFGADQPATVEAFRLGTGASNAYPAVGPVVISQIMYHPPLLGTNDNTRDEFIQLQNVTSGDVHLFDPSFRTNTWRLRDAVDFDFPTNVTMRPGGYLLVVSFSPQTDPVALAGFRSVYGSNAVIFGPYSGKLDNGGESVELYRPDAPQPPTGNEAGFVPYVRVDRVRYRDTAPWPPSADGSGHALHRVQPTGYGNDPVNWLAAAPTPSQSGSTDADEDGMPDSWEDDHGFNPGNPADAQWDFDNDGFSNLEEYRAGTDPRNAQDFLRILSMAPAGGMMTLSFVAAADRTYTVEYTDDLELEEWAHLQNVPAQATTRTVTVFLSMPASARFFRLRTP